MQAIQGELAELQKKYAKDRRLLAQEQMKLYKQSGMNPAGCIVPMLVQLPVWIALYQAIIKVLGPAPEDLLDLSRYLYSSWHTVFRLVPLESNFLWMDLSAPDRLMLLPILTGVTMWVQQKMSTVQSSDPAQQQQSQMMLWMMPLMFVVLSLSFPSGLALYWVVSNIIGIVMQYLVTGWGGLIAPKSQKKVSVQKKTNESAAPARPQIIEAEAKPASKEVRDGESGGKGKDSGGGNPPGTGSTWVNPRRSKGRRNKGR
jgi:YidC/Oxa1 family membrane protein insertase